MNNDQPYLSEAHRKASQAASEAIANQSSTSSQEFIEQVRRLASQSQRTDKSESSSSAPYAQSKNESCAF
jgi:hypothetical protein